MESGDVIFRDDLDILKFDRSIDFNSMARCGVLRTRSLSLYEKDINPLQPNLKPYTHKIKITNLPETVRSTQDYLDLPFFNAWLVGFTISEGSFFVKNNLDACFE
uniref:LAGLIDADG endonuclease n=1 Tax=Ramaria rubella TaxID=113071 RepID=UPI0022372A2D|nr:LAGLIDADG endonuclease [Ramaria rubella]UYR22255.1 LAGLIDADG endonuclease [Ramaria rubella]